MTPLACPRANSKPNPNPNPDPNPNPNPDPNPNPNPIEAEQAERRRETPSAAAPASASLEAAPPGGAPELDACVDEHAGKVLVLVLCVMLVMRCCDGSRHRAEVKSERHAV